MTEAWLNGPLPGFDPYLMPVAHALVQAREDVNRAAAALPEGQLWTRPGAAASAGFHLKHIAGSIDRLLAYARGEALSAEQLAYVAGEAEPGDPPAGMEELVAGVHAAIEAALAQLRATPRGTLLEVRHVGRKRLPSTVLGLLFHVGEHTTRHAGQLITTARVLSGAQPGAGA